LQASAAFFDALLAIPRDHALSLIASAFLLLLSATFSGCETALFSLSPPEQNRVRAGSEKVARIIDSLLRDLNHLLPTILFCNMAVNVFIFAISAAIGVGIAQRHGGGAAVLWSVLSLCVLIFFGEVFPKQIAIAARIPVARLTSPPVWLCYRFLAGPMSFLNAMVGVFERLVDAGRPDHAVLLEEELRLLMDFSRSDGVISENEYELIDGIVDLPDVKIRDIMVPRVDAIMIKRDSSCGDALQLARICRHTKLPVLEPEKDDLIGWVDVRELFVAGTAGPIGGYVKPLAYFSELDRADQVLRTVKNRPDAIMAVVDERGIVVGVFTVQDIMDEVLGDFGDYGAAPPDRIREQEGGYVVAGGVSVREWREWFNVSESLPRSVTVGGLVTALLGRPARRGESVTLGNMEMTVLSVWRNRVTEVLLRLVSPEMDNAASAHDDAKKDGCGGGGGLS
jgi:putative hemolysin